MTAIDDTGHMIDPATPRQVVGVRSESKFPGVHLLPGSGVHYFGPYDSLEDALESGMDLMETRQASPLVYMRCERFEDFSEDELSRYATFLPAPRLGMSIGGFLGAFVFPDSADLPLVLVMADVAQRSARGLPVGVYIVREFHASESLKATIHYTLEVMTGVWKRLQTADRKASDVL